MLHQHATYYRTKSRADHSAAFVLNLYVAKTEKYQIDAKIDRLTNSIINTISGDSFKTEINEVIKTDLKQIVKKNGWNFNWLKEFKMNDRKLYKLTIKDNPNIIQGLASISDYNDHFYLHLVESAPFNLGKNKLYEGVPGNLFSFTCKQSWDKGYEGFVSFQSKTKLIEHYEKSLGAVHVGGHKMVIFPHAALKLIQKYFQT